MKIELIKGDITKMEVDAIVNAANYTLMGGGGVDGAIHRAGGPDILAECIEIRNRQGGCDVGQAVSTQAGKLQAKKVIHTVGPRWHGGTSGEEVKLHECYINSLLLAERSGLESVAFPNISTGIYGYPKDKAAKVAIAAVRGFKPEIIKRVVFACYDAENYKLYLEELKDR